MRPRGVGTQVPPTSTWLGLEGQKPKAEATPLGGHLHFQSTEQSLQGRTFPQEKGALLSTPRAQKPISDEAALPPWQQRNWQEGLPRPHCSLLLLQKPLKQVLLATIIALNPKPETLIPNP